MKPVLIADESRLLNSARPVVPDDYAGIFLWNDYYESQGLISLPSLLDKDPLKYRDSLLKFVHDAGNIKVNNIPIKEATRLDGSGWSLWYSSLIAQKSPLKSTWTANCMKLFALEEKIQSLEYSSIKYLGSDSSLAQSLHDSCKKRNIEFTWKKSGPDFKVRFHNPLSPETYAIWNFFKRWIIPSVLFRLFSKAAAHVPDSRIFVSYFPNVNEAMAREGAFRSHYWENLHDIIQPLQNITWLLVYPFGLQYGLLKTLRIKNLFNKNRARKEFFFFIQEFMSFKIAFHALYKWFKYRKIFRKYTNALDKFSELSCSLYMFPFLKHDWLLSSRGWELLDAITWSGTFHDFLAKYEHARMSVFLWERQPWELAYISAWKKRFNSPIYGFQHSTMRILDTRMLEDPRAFDSNESVFFPKPDKLLVNGQGSSEIFLKSGMPSSLMLPVEALRHSYLKDLCRSRKPRGPNDKFRLLVAGDCIERTSVQLVQLVSNAMRSADYPAHKVELVFKPHPFRSLDAYIKKFLPGVQHKIINLPITTCFNACDGVLCANSTSVALEAAFSGLPVIIALDGSELNMSPLYGQHGVAFARNGLDIIQWLENPVVPRIQGGYFFFDETLSRWRDILQ